MATIFNNIDKVSGDPFPAVVVSVELKWDTAESPVAITDDETMIRGTYGTQTNSSGNWEVSGLVPNDQIEPAGSVYEVIERITTSNSVVTYYVSIPDSATPTYWVGDYIVEKPTWL